MLIQHPLQAPLAYRLVDHVVRRAGDAQSMRVTVWNLGIAGGGMAGGLLLQGWGVAAFPWAVGGLLLLAFGATLRMPISVR